MRVMPRSVFKFVSQLLIIAAEQCRCNFFSVFDTRFFTQCFFFVHTSIKRIWNYSLTFPPPQSAWLLPCRSASEAAIAQWKIGDIRFRLGTGGTRARLISYNFYIIVACARANRTNRLPRLTTARSFRDRWKNANHPATVAATADGIQYACETDERMEKKKFFYVEKRKNNFDLP